MYFWHQKAKVGGCLLTYHLFHYQKWFLYWKSREKIFCHFDEHMSNWNKLPTFIELVPYFILSWVHFMSSKQHFPHHKTIIYKMQQNSFAHSSFENNYVWQKCVLLATTIFRQLIFLTSWIYKKQNKLKFDDCYHQILFDEIFPSLLTQEKNGIDFQIHLVKKYFLSIFCNYLQDVTY